MTVEEIIALCHAGYNSDQIMQLAQAQQMERAQEMQPQQVQQMQQPQQVQQPQQPQQVQQMQQQMQQPQQPTQQPGGYEQIMSELLGLKQAVQAGNMMAALQPAQPQTAEDIIANIIAPKPRKETK